MNRLESGTIVLEHKPFDLTELLEETCGIIQMQGQAHRLRFQAQPWGIQHPHLLGSPLHLRQVLQNIGGNAVKYNRTGAASPSAVRRRAAPTEGRPSALCAMTPGGA